MATYDSTRVTGYLNGAVPSVSGSQAGGIMSDVGTHAITSSNYLNTGDIIRLCVLPAGHKIVNAIFASGALDAHASAKTLDMDIVVFDAGGTDVGETIYDSGGNIGRTAMQKDLMVDLLTVSDIGGFGPYTEDRIVGLKVITDPATDAAGSVGLRIFYQRA